MTEDNQSPPSSARCIHSPYAFVANTRTALALLLFFQIKLLWYESEGKSLSLQYFLYIFSYLGVYSLTWVFTLLLRCFYLLYMLYSNLSRVYCCWPPLWSSGQSFWLQIQRSRVRSPALPDFLNSSESGTGSTQPREVNWGATWMKKVAAPGLENRD